ncbi:MAG: hypothetical protein AAF799_13760 [Myxococcota bacterium]
MKKISTRSTKTEILAAYNAMAKELKSLKAKARTAPAPAQKALPPSPAEVAAREVSIGDIIRSLRDLTTSIGESSSSLQGELTAEATQLTDLREQANQVTADLRTLHEIEVSEDSLAELIARYEESSEAAERELTAKKEAFDDEIDAARTAWVKEQQQHKAALKEASRESDQARKRDAAEYAYELEQRTAKENDEEGQALKAFELEQVELRERKAAEWTERNKQLEARETERNELVAKAEAFEGKRDAAVKKAEAEGMAIARRQTKAENELRSKDNEGVRRVFELKVESLEGTIAKQEAQIKQLSRQLEDARKQTTELAVKAIDGASNASSFESIKEIALEQAKNTQKGK